MYEMIEARFAELMEEVGCEEWWETERYWEAWEEQMVTEGLDEEEVSNFFGELEEDM